MPQKYTNFARSTLASNIAAGDTTLAVSTSGDLFPVANTGATAITSTTTTDWFKAVLQNVAGVYEIVYVRTRTGGSNSFTNVVRGQDGTTALAWLAGDTVALRPVAADAEAYATQATTQTLSNKTIQAGVHTGVIDDTGSVRQGITAVAALDINCSLGNFFTKTINGNSTFTVSSVPTSRAYAFTLELTHTSGTVTWFAGVQWPNGTAPTLTTGKVHLFTFVTDDGGTTWRGASQINYSA